MSRRGLHVTTHPGGWQVKAAGAGRASHIHETKAAAV
jgi:hypothetical protein